MPFEYVEMLEIGDRNQIPFDWVQLLLKHHFDFFGYDIDKVISGEIDRNTSSQIYRDLYDKFQVYENTKTNYEHIAEHKREYYSEHLEKDVLILKNSEYISLTGTVKEHSEYNEIKQTLIQRPKLKK